VGAAFQQDAAWRSAGAGGRGGGSGALGNETVAVTAENAVAKVTVSGSSDLPSEQSLGRKPPRTGGFKISQLETMFANSTYISNVYMIARDQAGCRMLQQKLEEGNAEVTRAILSEVLAHIVDLMMDPFGNYLCQKLMEISSPAELELMLENVCGALVQISLNMHGARAAQKLVDVVGSTPSHVPRLVAALEGAVTMLAKDTNGNHVVQKCIEVLPPEMLLFIFQIIAQEIVDLSSHRHGCRIVQRCVDVAQGPARWQLIRAICQNSLTLVQDPFGNYVIQHVLEQNDAGSKSARSEIVCRMLGRLAVLSRQKFSSNVVERCLKLCTEEETSKMIAELADPRGLGELLRDVFGNYVVQSALSVAPEPLLSRFLAAIRPFLPSLRASGQGRRIVQKLEKKYPQLKSPSNSETAGLPSLSGSGCGGADGGRLNGGRAQPRRAK
jgi:hypothetical protein